MSHDPRSPAQISVTDAYLAMYRFVDAYWQRGGRLDGSVTLLRHAMAPAEGQGHDGDVTTNDPASWSDWLAAVRAELEKRPLDSSE